MRLHKFKIVIILFLIVGGTIMTLLTFQLDVFTFNSTKAELKRLYETEFDSCKIINTVEKEYPSAGYYNLFQVDCSSKTFPVLLENMTAENESIFKKDIIITKAKNDYHMTLKNGDQIILVSARHIENEGGLGFLSRLMIISIVILGTLVQFFIPDHYYNLKK
jgi:hypothetical protein